MTDLPHKYFAWRAGHHWRGGELLPVPEIRALLTRLAWKFEAFASTQTYDATGNCLSSPLYFDFDGPPDRVIADARLFVQGIEFVLNTTPKIYFSGSKGYHLILPWEVKHPLCHLLVKHFAEEICTAPTLDKRVYRTQAMFRIPLSIGSKLDRYKIELTRDELMKLDPMDIDELAKTQRMIETPDPLETLHESVLEEWMRTALRTLPDFTRPRDVTAYIQSMDTEFTPCLEHMLIHGAAVGERNETAFVLAKFFKLCSLPEKDAINAFHAYQPWRRFDERGEVTKVVRSVYRSHRPTALGCRGATNNAELMRARCSDRCHFAANFAEPKISDAKGTYTR